MDLYVLTEEPYHENSSVVLVTENKANAVSALLACPDSPPLNDYHTPETWLLQAWRDGKCGHTLALSVPNPYVPHSGKVVYYTPKDDEALPVDPHTFDFFQKD